MLPTVKFIVNRGFSREQATQVRRLMENYRRRYPRFDKRPMHTLEKISEVIGGFGVEYIPAGHNQRSPAITYVNMGDTYSTTVLWVNGQFAIGDWGFYVERGNYD